MNKKKWENCKQYAQKFQRTFKNRGRKDTKLKLFKVLTNYDTEYKTGCQHKKIQSAKIKVPRRVENSIILDKIRNKGNIRELETELVSNKINPTNIWFEILLDQTDNYVRSRKQTKHQKQAEKRSKKRWKKLLNQNVSEYSNH